MAELPIERARTFNHSIHELDAPFQVVSLRLEGLAVTAKQPLEHPTRAVFRWNRPSFQAIGDGARPGEKTCPSIDREHQRRLPAVLFGVQRHDLIESDRVESPWLRIVQR